MSKIDEGLGRRRVTGIFADDKTMVRPSVYTVEPNERTRGDYIAIHNHARRILSETHANAKECAFPIKVDGVIYHFNAIVDEGGHLTCRFVVIDDGEFAEEGHVRYPELENLFTKSILTYNLQPAFPLKEIGDALLEEIKSMVKVEVRTYVRARRMTTMDASDGTLAAAVKRKPTSYPLNDDARQFAEHLITNKDRYTFTASRTKSRLPDGRMFEILVRKVDEGLLLSYRDQGDRDFSVIFVPLNFKQEAYLKLPKDPPWADLKFVFGVR